MKKKYVVSLLVLLFLCSLPSLWNKIQSEHSANTVEFSIDYLSLLSLSEQSKDPEDLLDAMLLQLKEEGFTTLTIPNNTFSFLEERGLVSVLSSDELSTITRLSNSSNKTNTSIDRHLTYVLFLDKKIQKELTDMMHHRFPEHHLEQLVFNGQTFMGIDMPMSKLLNVSIPYLEEDISFLTQKPYEFSLVLKLDNKWQGHEDVAMEQLTQTPVDKISGIYFADAGVLGYPERHVEMIKDLPHVKFAYKEYFTQEERQKGIDTLANMRNYEMVRLHVIQNTLFMTHANEPQVLVDRITKAVTERNIRLFHLQFPKEMDEKSGKNIFISSLSVLKESKEELLEKGFTMGTSEPFEQHNMLLLTISQWVAAVTGVGLIALASSFFLPKWTKVLILLLLALLFSSWKFTVVWQILALLVAISIPVLVAKTIYTMQNENVNSSLKSTIIRFLLACTFSLLGGLLLSSMHSDLAHLLYFEPFRGVSLAHIVPPFLVILLMLKLANLWHKDTLLYVANEPIRIYQVLLLGIIGVVGIYYVSRTGNTGVLLPFEEQFRSLLENTLGVRPRTKEFLLAHPLMIVVLYYWHKRKWVKWGLPIAIVGQLSMVNTFTHFHTPVWISLQRGVYGTILGLVIGLVLIGCIEAIKWFLNKKTLHKN